MCCAGIKPRPPARKANAIPLLYKSRFVPEGSTSLSNNCHYSYPLSPTYSLLSVQIHSNTVRSGWIWFLTNSFLLELQFIVQVNIFQSLRGVASIFGGLLPDPITWWIQVLLKVTSSSALDAPGSPSISRALKGGAAISKYRESHSPSPPPTHTTTTATNIQCFRSILRTCCTCYNVNLDK